ncbi:fibrinogen-related protein 3.1 [Plakobranchus ocellatus]|uniref:Fibrinogen-related protein 3.1 n=1 Tax=Plakobranchus ocellatus TaxID=259542 RepID=A0AAV3ZBY7_9GAST|nr:fibrinogen-related protein 3.1 [Plakobranchus ocellatus]
MKRILFFIWGLNFFSIGNGLELNLDVQNPHSGRPGASVCVLKCVENHKPGSITKMSIFQNSQPSASDAINDGRGRLVASLNKVHSRITRDDQGVKVEGRLSATQAVLSLEMEEKQDCLAQYTCEIRRAGGRGKDQISSNSIRQLAEVGGTSSQSGGQASEGSLQLLILQQQQLDTKLALVEASLESKVGALLDTKTAFLSTIINNIEARIDAFEHRLVDTIQSSQGNTESHTNELENLIERGVVDKLSQMENKLSTIHDEVNSASGVKRSPSVVSQRVQEGATSKNTINASSLHTQLSQILNRDQKDRLWFQNVSASMQEINNRYEALGSQVTNDFLALKNSLEINCAQVKSCSNVQKEALSTFGEQVPNSTKSVISYVLGNGFCRKGISDPSQTSFPYPVIYPDKGIDLAVPYLCDTVTDGGGWIVIQRRATGNQDFYRNWDSYKRGFGSLDGDFWLGNENIHAITSSWTYELRIELKYQNKSAFAHYNTFSLGSEQTNYILKLGEYDGTAGDDLSYHRGKQFSTFDRDNDDAQGSCAVAYTGGWWYANCHDSNLNGLWQANGFKGPRWNTLSGEHPVSFSEMKIRRQGSV